MSNEAARQRVTRKGNGVRMQEIAALAGVSAMTVSRALRDPDSVSSDTLGRVQAAIRDTGYVSNQLAGSLSSRRTNVVGLILPGIQNSLYAATVQAISDVLRIRGYHLMITDSGLRPRNEEEAIAAFLGQRVCGLMLHNTTHTTRAKTLIRSAGVPTIEIGNLVTQPLDMCVSYSSFAAAKAMTVHLGRLGYRRIAFVSLPRQENDRAAERMLGYQAGLKELGQKDDPTLIMETQSGFPGGQHALITLLEADATIDAIFFSADVMAVGALFECQRRGWPVPGRIAIASFDDLDLLRHVVPSITTLRIPRQETGRRSAELLLGRLEGETGQPRIVDLGFEVIQRDST
jgi:LacI family gluconate utilization system Gnt-I transcriptional repressor